MPREEKGKKRKSSAGGSTTEGATAERTGVLYKEKYIGEQDEVL